MAYPALRKWKHAIEMAPLRRLIAGETCSAWITWSTNEIVS
jgi:hypothetical protein